jgi:hypothetical protein
MFVQRFIKKLYFEENCPQLATIKEKKRCVLFGIISHVYFDVLLLFTGD